MFTRDERRALLFLGAVALAGGAVRAARRAGGESHASAAPSLPAAEDVRRQMARVREVEARERPLAPGERIDLDRADRAEIERLPRVGPELARRIVEHRETHGPFGSLAALDEVPGVGAALLASLERYVSFSGARLPARGGPPGAAPRPSGRGCEEGARVAVNRATEAELDCLPGIGPALARAIVADRASRGPYRQVEDLARVKGIGPALLGRLAPRLLVP